MERRGILAALGCAVLLAGCSDGDDNRPTGAQVPAELRVVHASADAPNVDVEVNGTTAFSNVAFRQATAAFAVLPGSAEVTVRGRLPGGARPAVIGPANLTIAAGARYAVLAIDDLASIEPLVVERPTDAVPAGSARLQVVHAAPTAPRVAVFLTAPGADLAAAAPVGSFAFRGVLGPASVPSGEYQVRVTPEGQPGTVVFDAGTLRLDAGADLLIAAIPNTRTGDAPIALLLAGAGDAVEVLDRAAPAGVRVVHASPDTPPVSVFVNDDFANPLVPNLAFPDATPFVFVPPATYNVKVTPAANPGLVAINADLRLDRGTESTVLAVGRLATIEPLVLADDRRRIGAFAKVRIVHGSPTAGPVDLYVVAPGASIAAATPAFANVPFKANTGYVSLAAGSYDVVATPAGTKTAAIGPARITVENGGLYTAVARDAAGGGLPLGLILMDDFAP
jgi:hypothetical protein